MRQTGTSRTFSCSTAPSTRIQSLTTTHSSGTCRRVLSPQQKTLQDQLSAMLDAAEMKDKDGGMDPTELAAIKATLTQLDSFNLQYGKKGNLLHRLAALPDMQSGLKSIEKMLLEKDHENLFTQKNNDGMTPMMLAIRHGNVSLVELFCKLNAHEIHDENSDSPLHYACKKIILEESENLNNAFLKIIAILIKNQCDPHELVNVENIENKAYLSEILIKTGNLNIFRKFFNPENAFSIFDANGNDLVKFLKQKIAEMQNARNAWIPGTPDDSFRKLADYEGILFLFQMNGTASA
ncbi:ankyrin repeat domain-containing protein [Paraburkholderia bonniea]|nr:ankyrin repeat domain-containing protein [Paraburkholderia bonniea]WJF91858.1 ankyrin repeat domain-containing protein [Paraburkholderia bonniea]WJF95177.1 ankyrin repeat domain-containing protein [Paraburkholderia bonniea]